MCVAMILAPPFPVFPQLPLRIAHALQRRTCAHNRPPCPANPKKAISSAASSSPKAANSTWSSSAELKGTDDASRTDLKRESDELQKLGGEPAHAARRPVRAPRSSTEKLVDALAEAKRITNFEGKRRQMQFIGKLMRKLDPEALEAVQRRR